MIKLYYVISRQVSLKAYFFLFIILHSAIELKGSTGELDLYGNPRKYIRIMDKESAYKEYKRCGTRIIKVNIPGSSTYFSPACQKI